MCDRCRLEITGDPVRITPHFMKRRSEEGFKKVPLWMERLMHCEFCEECANVISNFAMNGKTCDECIQEMEEERKMLGI